MGKFNDRIGNYTGGVIGLVAGRLLKDDDEGSVWVDDTVLTE